MKNNYDLRDLADAEIKMLDRARGSVLNKKLRKLAGKVFGLSPIEVSFPGLLR